MAQRVGAAAGAAAGQRALEKPNSPHQYSKKISRNDRVMGRKADITATAIVALTNNFI